MDQTQFYKAAREDTYDFYSRTLDYQPGFTYYIHGPERDLRPELCTNRVLHASASPADTLIGGSWPCRLFNVEGIPVCTDGRKSGFHEFTVTREVPAWWALGPNGRQAVWLLDKIRGATAADIRRMGAAWGAARDAARGAAWGAARDAARGAAWGAAWGAAREAALSVVVMDIIRSDQFDTLYGPFRSVFGDPPMFADDGGYPA